MQTLRNRIGLKGLIVSGTGLFALALLLTSLYAPESFAASFISMNILHTYLRIATLAGLLIVLVTRPPRPMQVRMFLGMMSSVILIGALAAMTEYQIGVLDAVLYLQVSIIMAMEAIENKTAPVQFAKQTSLN